jgi:hypothetical protein
VLVRVANVATKLKLDVGVEEPPKVVTGARLCRFEPVTKVVARLKESVDEIIRGLGVLMPCGLDDAGTPAEHPPVLSRPPFKEVPIQCSVPLPNGA